jgi:type IV secretory pathway VirB10-like protein
MSNPKTRLTIITTTLVIGVMAAFGIGMLNRSSKTPNQLKAEVNLAGAPSIDAVPGVTNNPKYAEAVNDANNAAFNNAVENGGSSLPKAVKLADNATVTFGENGSKLDTPIPPVAKVEVPAVAVQTQVPLVPPMMQQVQYQYQQAPTYTQQTGNQAVVSSMGAGGGKQVEVLLDRWSPTGQTMEIDYTGASKNTQGASAGYGATPNMSLNAGGQMSGSSDLGAAQQAAPTLRAGTIVPAILKTGVNTDEPGPVLAEIVSGPLRGSTVMGTLTNSNNPRAESVALSFGTISPITASKSYPLQAFAINPNSQEGAIGLATSVDKHYLERFGLLFGASWLQGYGQALQQSGSTVTTNPLGGTTVSTPQRTTQELNKIAFGQVGTNIGQAMAQNSNRAVTIKVAQGTAIGLLIMQDLFVK